MKPKTGAVSTYTVYFEIYGKKMKTNVLATSRGEAERTVRSKLKINKIEGDDKNSTSLEDLLDLLGMNY